MRRSTVTYIDGFAAAVPTANKDAFIEHAEYFWEIAKDFGCLRQMECWGDDVPGGEQTSFPMAVKAKEDETVVFSFLEWPDKETRDKGMKGMMEDPRMDQDKIKAMPFDGKRMIMGGFIPVVDRRTE